jgi:lipopolysaccharide/colanic/teichoic acid biosynthesis glycosyltransferase
LRPDSETLGHAGRQRPSTERSQAARRALHAAGRRLLDLSVSTVLLLVLAPVVLAVSIAIKLDSRGPVFYRCRRIGFQGREFRMLKFRKMRDDVSGPALTAVDDERFTRFGRFLAGSKLDEIPQLWNVIRGEMSLVGPRPEDPSFVAERPEEFATVHAVKPGITGLSQLAFAKESEILDPEDRVGHYLRQILPQKLAIDRLYAERSSLRLYLSVLFWTAAAVLFHRDVAVHRTTGKLTARRPRTASLNAVPLHRELAS